MLYPSMQSTHIFFNTMNLHKGNNLVMLTLTLHVSPDSQVSTEPGSIGMIRIQSVCTPVMYLSHTPLYMYIHAIPGCTHMLLLTQNL